MNDKPKGTDILGLSNIIILVAANTQRNGNKTRYIIVAIHAYLFVFFLSSSTSMETFIRVS